MAIQLRNRFAKATDVLSYFSVPRMMEVRRKKGISGLTACVMVDYPTLCDIRHSHGLECAYLLVEVFIVNLLDAVNLPGKKAENPPMEEWQISETAQLLYEECPSLKITELLEFIQMIKKGRYGEFYGAIDCIKIMSDFREFMQDRAAAISAVVQAKEKERRRKLEQFKKKLPEEREEWLKTLTDAQKIELMVCPACHSTLIGDTNTEVRCISCNYKR